MLAYIARRLLSTLPVMGLVALVVFAILRLTPGYLAVGDAPLGGGAV